MGAKPQPCYNRIRVINNSVIMRLQCSYRLLITSVDSGRYFFHSIHTQPLSLWSVALVLPWRDEGSNKPCAQIEPPRIMHPLEVLDLNPGDWIHRPD